MLSGMKTLNSILLAACALGALPGLAAAQEAAQLMDKIAGVYKHRFMNAAYSPGAPSGSGDPYQSENVIEIVPFDATHIYVRAELEFYNGHQCGISGMAGFENGKFVYHDPEPPIAGHVACVLRVGVDKGKLTLSDRDGPDGESSCWTHCGARGSLTYDIGLDKRRPIRYMDRLKASRQYKQAVDELRQTEPPAR
jgi:hypothetical protein